MKTLIAAAAMSLAAASAFAAEGNGDPFAFHFAEKTVQTAPLTYRGVAQSQNPYPFTVPTVGWGPEAVVQPMGSAGTVQSANSLPPGFTAGEPGTTLTTPPAQLAHVAPGSDTHG